ncbi:MAG: hypothetical protein Phog2KO_50590 [Phototrophicaceae bacterium]
MTLDKSNWIFYRGVLRDPYIDAHFEKPKPDLFIDFADIYEPAPEDINEKLDLNNVYQAIVIGDEFFQNHGEILDLKLWCLVNATSTYTGDMWILCYECEKDNLLRIIRLHASISENKIVQARIDIYEEGSFSPDRTEDLDIKKHLSC